MRIKNLINNCDILPESNIISLKSNERFVINPGEYKTITLPYTLFTDESELIFFHFSFALAERGLVCVETNIYENDAERIELILQNIKIQSSLSQLEYLTGSNLRIDIKPNTVLGKLFCNKITA